MYLRFATLLLLMAGFEILGTPISCPRVAKRPSSFVVSTHLLVASSFVSTSFVHVPSRIASI